MLKINNFLESDHHINEELYDFSKTSSINRK